MTASESPEVKLGLVANVFSKMMHFKKAGDCEQGHSHCFDHLTLLAHGRIKIEVGGIETEFQSPNMIFIKAGVEHKLTAVQDETIIYCIHALRDGDGVGDIIDPSMIPKGITADKIEVSGIVKPMLR